MAVQGLTLAEAEESDLQWIIDVEKDAVKGGFVSGDPEVRHRLQMNDRQCLYLIAKRGSERSGYVILRGITGPSPVVELKRIVVTHRDAGHGTSVLGLVLNFAFVELKAHRLWLDVIEDNDRAIHVYRKMGFVEEGRFRKAAQRTAGWRDLVIFGMLDSEYRKNG